MRALRPIYRQILSKRSLPLPTTPRARFVPQAARQSIHTSASGRTGPSSLPSTSQFSHTVRQLWKSQLRDIRSIRRKSSAPNPTPQLGSPKPESTLKKLFREYGWSAVGVYLILTLADLPICFGIVRWVGAERVGEYEHKVLDYIRKTRVFEFVRRSWHQINPMSDAQSREQTMPAVEDTSTATVREGVIGGDIEPARAAAQDGEATIWTQLALAYAIHKSIFIFIRIPLTVAITPKVVKTLRSWGWQIGKRPVRPNRPKKP